VGTGALLIAGFFVLMLATDVAGMSLAIGVMRVSVVIPFLASWLVWNEVPTLAQGVGMALAGVAFFLIAWQSPTQEAVLADAGADADLPPSPAAVLASTAPARVFGVLALTFVMGGAVDVTMKAFEESFGATNSRVLFLLLAFGVAFLIGAAIVLVRGLRRGVWPEQRTVLWGIGLGVINYGSLEFILRAIERLPGTFVFPANNIAIVVLAAVLGVAVWNETLTRPNRVGLGLAVLALLLLNL
jgi:drug/metabolite transporter (DMT)-like permease